MESQTERARFREPECIEPGCAQCITRQQPQCTEQTSITNINHSQQTSFTLLQLWYFGTNFRRLVEDLVCRCLGDACFRHVMMTSRHVMDDFQVIPHTNSTRSSSRSFVQLASEMPLHSHNNIFSSWDAEKLSCRAHVCYTRPQVSQFWHGVTRTYLSSPTLNFGTLCR